MATIEHRVLDLLRGLVREIGHERAIRAVSVDARLDRDLGLDSLARMELLHRIEAAFRVRLPDLAMAEARTVQDIIQAISDAEGKEPRVPFRPEASAAPLPESILGLPESAATLIEVLLRHAEAQPDRVHLYLGRDDEKEEPMTYGELLQEGLKVANGLRQQGVGHGETVALMLPTSAEF
ncbi:MAG: AMP-binding protein, partial [Nitrospirae bacterium]|nr:AMP-binding protein [Nitrospirota bacterium]